MDFVSDLDLECPFCGELTSISIDTAELEYSTIVDCSVCCRAIQIVVRCKRGQAISVNVCGA